MKKITFFLLSLSIYLRAADTGDIFHQRFGKMGLGPRQQTNIARALREQQFGKPFSKQYMNQLIQKEKDKLLSSSGLETSTIPISLNDAYKANKIKFLVAVWHPPVVLLAPRATNATKLLYINSADGLSDIPITMVIFGRSGSYEFDLDPVGSAAMEMLSSPPEMSGISPTTHDAIKELIETTMKDTIGDLTPSDKMNAAKKIIEDTLKSPVESPIKSEIESVIKRANDQINMMKSQLNEIQLQITNIHEIYPHQLTVFRGIQKIYLPTSTPERLRKKNAQRNPNIKFVYQDEIVKI